MVIAGASVSIDATALYGIMTSADCKRMLPLILTDHKSKEGFCFSGSIFENFKGA
jgi:hypothetical protein|tara:strand:+ start:1801 stop:1965 length:165 start_codon:yes stop_codon:yes gene_type:complete